MIQEANGDKRGHAFSLVAHPKQETPHWPHHIWSQPLPLALNQDFLGIFHINFPFVNDGSRPQQQLSSVVKPSMERVPLLSFRRTDSESTMVLREMNMFLDLNKSENIFFLHSWGHSVPYSMRMFTLKFYLIKNWPVVLAKNTEIPRLQFPWLKFTVPLVWLQNLLSLLLGKFVDIVGYSNSILAECQNLLGQVGSWIS